MTIKKVKEGYRLVSKKGKNLGTYDTKEGAEKRRAADNKAHNDSYDAPQDEAGEHTGKTGYCIGLQPSFLQKDRCPFRYGYGTREQYW